LDPAIVDHSPRNPSSFLPFLRTTPVLLGSWENRVLDVEGCVDVLEGK
jgi:hypothetical protein